MIKALSRISYHKFSVKFNFVTVKKSLNLNSIEWNSKSSKSFSLSNATYHDQRHEKSFTQTRQLPDLFYFQNPITWLINKIDFMMLKRAWDSDFDEEDFKRGVKQAVSVICILISKNLWVNLRGLVTSKSLERLQRDVKVNWSADQRKSIAIEPSDIKLVLPRKVHFLRIADQKFVDVDVICVAMKFKENEPSEKADVILTEILTRFHRNYTTGQLPNWTVTLFKVTRQNISLENESETRIADKRTFLIPDARECGCFYSSII